MNIKAIDTMVAEAATDQRAATDLQQLLSAVASRNNAQPSKADLAAGVQFVFGYLEQVPYMLRVAITAAKTVGLEAQMCEVVSMVESYWEKEEDIIPDHLGVIGLLDDAYCSLTTLQAFSGHYQLQTGKHLFPEDLTAANRVMREIIGAPYAGDLDRFVGNAITSSGVMSAVKALASVDKHRHLAANANIWNHGPAGEMPVAQLHGLGIITD
jgi:hypothetical protein